MNYNRCAVVTVGMGKWYPRGVARLIKSLIAHDWAGTTWGWTNELPPDSPSHAFSPYGFKAASIKWASDKGYRYILWMDASLYAIRPIGPIFDWIEKYGYYFCHNGFNCAQTASDKMLVDLAITRDEAEKMPELTGCIMGYDLANETTKKFFERYHKASLSGVFLGEWKHNPNDSQDPRFRFCRHDQSYASLLANQMGMMDWAHGGEGGLFQYAGTKEPPESVVCLNRGM